MCAVKGCEERIHAKGWCTTHYARWRRNGDPVKKVYRTEPIYIVKNEDQHLWAWCAGFYDGEGSTWCSRNNSLSVTISQNDSEVLEKFRVSIGVGLVRGPYYRKGYNPYWKYTASGKAGIIALSKMWRWLGTIKQEQATQALEMLV